MGQDRILDDMTADTVAICQVCSAYRHETGPRPWLGGTAPCATAWWLCPDCADSVLDAAQDWRAV